jgi:hypothetical protein
LLTAAVDRLVMRLRENGAGDAAPKQGDPMPPFLLLDEANRLVSLEQLLHAGPVAVNLSSRALVFLMPHQHQRLGQSKPDDFPPSIGPRNGRRVHTRT